MKLLIKVLMTMIMFYIVCCTSANLEELTPKDVVIDTNVTYTATVIPLLQNYQCYSCHSQSVAFSLGGGIVLESYSNIKVYIDNKRLYGAINHDPGFQPMPQGGYKMSSNDILRIKLWIDKGALNN